ncbi:hypothetical protein M9435_006995 [Picochlorum sp. BPE23]|nr:hypothetical protein M9435_006995 [Picochlorum sp. BPE23]
MAVTKVSFFCMLLGFFRAQTLDPFIYRNLFDSYQAVVSDGTLYISNPKSGSGTGGVVVLVSAPSDAINKITLGGQGQFSMVEGFTADTFDIEFSEQGAADISIDIDGALTINRGGQGKLAVVGKSGSLSLNVTGQGETAVFGVQGDAEVNLNGQGDAFVGGSASSTITGETSMFSPVGILEHHVRSGQQMHFLVQLAGKKTEGQKQCSFPSHQMARCVSQHRLVVQP